MPLQHQIKAPSNPIYDKCAYLIPFILSLLSPETQDPIHLETQSPHLQTPLFLGVSGPQGVGKTTLLSSLAQTLQEVHGFETVVLSIDDFYITHEEQTILASENEENELVRFRGEPGTHDVERLRSVIQALLECREVQIPRYDKSACGGRGDRIEIKKWKIVNTASQRMIQIFILEGWCVGFRAHDDDLIDEMFDSSPSISLKLQGEEKTWRTHKKEHIKFVNKKLRDYEAIWNAFHAFVHLDAVDIHWVYEWREEAEKETRMEKGEEFAMSSEQVRKFVDGYMPAYELYLDGVRSGIFNRTGSEPYDKKINHGKQLDIMVDRARNVIDVARQ